MILAAGLGTRLKPITDTIPKALVKVGNKTLLQYNIERMLAFGIKDIVINVHHFSEKITKYLHDNNNFNANIQISDEIELLLDTGGGIKYASQWLASEEPILIQNVDIFTNINYENMLNHHLASNALATLAVRNRESTRYLLFNKNNVMCGWQNIKTNEKIITRNDDNLNSLAFSCTHIISPKLLQLLPDKKVFSIIDVYLELSKHHKVLAYMHNDDYWFDIGTPDKLQRVEQFLSNEI